MCLVLHWIYPEVVVEGFFYVNVNSTTVPPDVLENAEKIQGAEQKKFFFVQKIN